MTDRENKPYSTYIDWFKDAETLADIMNNKVGIPYIGLSYYLGSDISENLDGGNIFFASSKRAFTLTVYIDSKDMHEIYQCMNELPRLIQDYRITFKQLIAEGHLFGAMRVKWEETDEKKIKEWGDKLVFPAKEKE